MKPNFLKTVHEKTDPRPGSPHHFGQSFLADFGHDIFWHAIFSEVRE